MAVSIFAKIGTIKGESRDAKHKDEVEILSWSWGVTNSGTIGRGSGGGTGKATFSDFSFTHHIDKASPILMKACATGEHIKDATITVRKAEYRPGARENRTMSTANASGRRSAAVAWFCQDCSSSLRPVESVTRTSMR